VEEDKQNSNSNGPWWKEGVALWGEVSTWIFVPIVLTLIVGKYLDGRWGTEPKMLLILAGVGFLVTTYGIVKVIRNYMRKIKNGK